MDIDFSQYPGRILIITIGQNGKITKVEKIAPLEGDEFDNKCKCKGTCQTKEKDSEYTKDVEFIVKQLNSALGKNFKPTNRMTRRKIIARLREGYKLGDFMDVIHGKHRDWIGTEWEKYLRPETLFGTKMDSYLNQIRSEKKLTNTSVKNAKIIKEWEDKKC